MDDELPAGAGPAVDARHRGDVRLLAGSLCSRGVHERRRLFAEWYEHRVVDRERLPRLDGLDGLQYPLRVGDTPAREDVDGVVCKMGGVGAAVARGTPEALLQRQELFQVSA